MYVNEEVRIQKEISGWGGWGCWEDPVEGGGGGGQGGCERRIEVIVKIKKNGWNGG